MNKSYNEKLYRKLDAFQVFKGTKDYEYIASSCRFKTCKQFKEYIESIGLVAPCNTQKVVVKVAKE